MNKSAKFWKPTHSINTEPDTTVEVFMSVNAMKIINTVGKIVNTAIKDIYRVRKSWADANSQIGAYSNLNNAKKACKEGYTVYNSKGVAIYDNVSEEETDGYLVKVTANTLNVRKSATILSKVVTTIKENEIYTIVETKGDWGRLKSGAGWISLKYTQKI